jgi:putative flippase GtrA
MKSLKKEIPRFIIAGLSAVFTDFISYIALLYFLQHDYAKTISFILGSIVAFNFNKYWTFKRYLNNKYEIIKFIMLYTTTLYLNISTNRLSLELTDMILLSFVVATGISTMVNFIGQKFWVFK